MRALPTGTVTFLFTDIEGSTQLLTALGNRYPQLLGRHHELSFVHRLRPRVERGLDRRRRVLRRLCRRAIGDLARRQAAQRLFSAESWPNRLPVRVRMGVHTGIGELLGDTGVGIDVHRASRIGVMNTVGQVLVSDATRALLGSGLPADLSLSDLGEHRLKDLPSAEHIFQLLATGLLQSPRRSARSTPVAATCRIASPALSDATPRSSSCPACWSARAS